jgi:hypothetical protein
MPRDQETPGAGCRESGKSGFEAEARGVIPSSTATRGRFPRDRVDSARLA